MATDWKWRLIIIVHVDANTPDNRTAFAEAFANNGSGQTVEDERAMFQSAVKLALASTPTVHRAFGLSTPVKASMRTALLNVIAQIDSTLTAGKQTVYYGVANVDNAPFSGNTYNEGECFFASRAEDSDFIGQVLRPRDILQRLNLVVLDEA